MTDPISPVRSSSTIPLEADGSCSSREVEEQSPTALLPEPLPQSSCSADPSFDIAALYVQMLHDERSSSRKDAILDEARIQSEVAEKIKHMHEAADARFAQAMASGITKMAGGALQATGGFIGVSADDKEEGQAWSAAFRGLGESTNALGELGAGYYGRKADAEDRSVERHGANAEAATRRQQADSEAASDLGSQLDRVLGYVHELDQARADALSAAVFRA